MRKLQFSNTDVSKKLISAKKGLLYMAFTFDLNKIFSILFRYFER